MKIISSKTVNGKKRVVVEVADGDQLIAVQADAYYQLGEPHDDDIIQGHVILGAAPAAWCSIEQKWRT